MKLIISRPKCQHSPNIKAIKNIQERFSKNQNQMDMFKASCFGHLINTQYLQFSGTIINSLLLMEEFAQVTGLNCKPLYKPNTNNMDGDGCASL